MMKLILFIGLASLVSVQAYTVKTTKVPPTAAPHTAAPHTAAPHTAVPPTAAPPTVAPPTCAPLNLYFEFQTGVELQILGHTITLNASFINNITVVEGSVDGEIIAFESETTEDGLVIWTPVYSNSCAVKINDNANSKGTVKINDNVNSKGTNKDNYSILPYFGQDKSIGKVKGKASSHV